jgi:hypothetical protein
MAVPMGRLFVQNYEVLSQDFKKGVCALEIADTLEINPIDTTHARASVAARLRSNPQTILSKV